MLNFVGRIAAQKRKTETEMKRSAPAINVKRARFACRAQPARGLRRRLSSDSSFRIFVA
jgi:hypothetical protein